MFLNIVHDALNTVQLSTMNAAAAKGRLDRAAVVTAALRIADDEGLDALTIRRLAQDLGVTPTALYWHFTDKQAVLDAVADQLWEDARGEIGELGAGDDAFIELRRIFEGLVAVLRRHPAVAPLAPMRAIDCDAALSITERTLELLGRVGFAGARAADAARLLLCTAIMLVTSQPGAAMPDRADREEMLRHKRAALLTLPPGRYPHVEGAAEHLVDCVDDPDAYYALGVDLMVSGLRDNAPAAARQ